MKKLPLIIMLILTSTSSIFAQGETKAKFSNTRNMNYMVAELQSQISEKYFDIAKGKILIAKLDEMLTKHLLDTSSLKNAAAEITKMLRAETNDKHFDLLVLDNKEQAQRKKDEAGNVGAGISEIKILNKHIGYLKWDLCVDGENATNRIRGALNYLEGCSALIIDITENPGGGSQSGAYLNSILYASNDYQKLLLKKCRTESDWQPSEPIYNNSDFKSFHNVPLYILTSPQTASAAEYFALTIKETKRGKVLGQTSAGAGNPGRWSIFGLSESDKSFYMFIPTCQIKTKDGLSIEGIGVKPNIELTSKDRIAETVKYILSESDLYENHKHL
ncbi:S41 family peptidase [Pedobacter sp. BAL39]|uniref:S41 family peptidase n=1 Tax=Pedobacter sp. BAL39 TaxID=391596 RepID=UPI0002EEA40B|nr:S41 family peptidase [Pedobacter sp. BAL39]